MILKLLDYHIQELEMKIKIMKSHHILTMVEHCKHISSITQIDQIKPLKNELRFKWWIMHIMVILLKF